MTKTSCFIGQVPCHDKFTHFLFLTNFTTIDRIECLFPLLPLSLLSLSNNNINKQATMMTPPCPTRSALQNFLGEILNDSVSFQIQNDNARMLAAGSCCTQQRRNRKRVVSGSLVAPPFLTIQDDQHRVVHKASARWETHITSNDFIVTAPLRRKVYCEPEKMNGYVPMRSAQIPLKELAGQFTKPANPDMDCKPSVNFTSDLLDEALDLLAD